MVAITWPNFSRFVHKFPQILLYRSFCELALIHFALENVQRPTSLFFLFIRSISMSLGLVSIFGNNQLKGAKYDEPCSFFRYFSKQFHFEIRYAANSLNSIQKFWGEIFALAGSRSPEKKFQFEIKEMRTLPSNKKRAEKLQQPSKPTDLNRTQNCCKYFQFLCTCGNLKLPGTHWPRQLKWWYDNTNWIYLNSDWFPRTLFCLFVSL